MRGVAGPLASLDNEQLTPDIPFHRPRQLPVWACEKYTARKQPAWQLRPREIQISHFRTVRSAAPLKQER